MTRFELDEKVLREDMKWLLDKAVTRVNKVYKGKSDDYKAGVILLMLRNSAIILEKDLRVNHGVTLEEVEVNPNENRVS